MTAKIIDMNSNGRFMDPFKIVQLFGLQEGYKFADFGSGTGAFVLAAAPLVGNTGTVLAIDIQKDALLKLKDTVIQNEYPNTKFLWCDFENLGATQLPDESIDVALISNTLFQLDDRAGALREAYRVMKDSGNLYIIDWTDSFKGMGPDKDLIIVSDQASRIAQDAGFKLVNSFTPGEHHYGLHFKK
ncbi:MAG: methyltransferase domain-containing protein [Candidatus Pacebacteria bacterium]|nr:methyltransferase domain-containing protein [Candidatus Paceibacterota bacterium]